MVKRLTKIIFLLSISIYPSFAQQKLSLTIEQAIQTGLENSKALRTSQFKVQAADAKASETNTLGLPSLKFNGTYTRLSSVPGLVFPFPVGGVVNSDNTVTLITQNYPLTSDILNNYGLKATVQQPLFTGGKISGAIDAAEYSATATHEDFRKDHAEVLYSIKQAYWNLYRAIEFKKFVDENVDQIKSHTIDAENLFKQGLLTTNDVMKVRVQYSDALVRQIDAKNNVQLAMLMLNNTLGLPLQTEIALASTINIANRDWSPTEQLIKTAFEKRPEMLGMNARVKAGEAGVTSARGGWWPQVYFVGNYDYNRPNQRYFPATDEFKDSWDVSVSVSFDLWNWNQTGHQTTQAQAQLAQAQEGLSMTKDGITLEVTQCYLNIQKAKERKVVSEQEVAQAEENYRTMEGKYKQGLAANSELLDAEVALLQAKLNLTQSLVDYELANAQLSKAIGE
ncbi:MAG TPA: TolC family protein [Bacteroidota bacterium]|nr:TolC family protein [Bacteroidota bacterium]